MLTYVSWIFVISGMGREKAIIRRDISLAPFIVIIRRLDGVQGLIKPPDKWRRSIS